MITAWAIAARLVPVIKELVKALKKNSDGGKHITPAERDAILGAVMGGIGERLEEIIDEVNSKPARRRD